MLFRNELTDMWTRQGRRIGRKEGLEKGHEQGQRDLLLSLFERRLQRVLTENEKTCFDAWWNTAGGPEEMSNAVIDLAANELATRLTRKRRAKPSR